MTELVQEMNLREAGRLIGRGREAVRKFVSGEIGKPHDRTLRNIARVYFQKYPDKHPAVTGRGTAAVAERAAPAPTPTPLKLILPPELENATAEIRAVFDRLRREGDIPPSAAALEMWLLRRVKEEYAAEVPYPRQRKARKKREP